MTEHDAHTCEVKIDGAWRLVGLSEAHTRHRDALKRCPACHGQVATSCRYVQPPRFSTLHRRSHDGCSLKPDTFIGWPSPHPQALA